MLGYVDRVASRCVEIGLQPANAPEWDRHSRELRLGAKVLKRYQKSATNQMFVLESFQKRGWPAQIDNPLTDSPDGEVFAVDRIKEAINQLNRSQQAIHFGRERNGTSVTWRRRTAAKGSTRIKS
jgi:hypothetical protein